MRAPPWPVNDSGTPAGCCPPPTMTGRRVHAVPGVVALVIEKKVFHFAWLAEKKSGLSAPRLELIRRSNTQPLLPAFKLFSNHNPLVLHAIFVFILHYLTICDRISRTIFLAQPHPLRKPTNITALSLRHQPPSHKSLFAITPFV